MTPRNGQAFTLTELIVVLLVISVVAAAVTLSAAGPTRLAEATDAVGAARHFDRLARQSAVRRGRPVMLVFDLDAGTIACRDRAAGEDEPPIRSCRLPKGVRLGRLVTAAGAVESGQVGLWCSDRGLSASYAVRLDGTHARPRLLVSGLTGQAIEVENEKAIEEAFALLAPKRHDAR